MNTLLMSDMRFLVTINLSNESVAKTGGCQSNILEILSKYVYKFKYIL